MLNNGGFALFNLYGNYGRKGKLPMGLKDKLLLAERKYTFKLKAAL